MRTGEIPLSVWNDDIEKVNFGDRIRVTNAVVREFKNKPALNLVRGSTIEKLG